MKSLGCSLCPSAQICFAKFFFPSYLIGSIWSLHELFSLNALSFFLLSPNIHIPRGVTMKNEWVRIRQSLGSLNRLIKAPEKLLFNAHNRRELNYGRQSACADVLCLSWATPRCPLLSLFLTAKSTVWARSCADARGQSALPCPHQIVSTVL